MQKKTLISIVGPTGVGKTALALRLASTFGTEVISADSRQLYRELNIGTAKPTAVELDSVMHHFINSHSINDDFDAGQFSQGVGDLLDDLFKKYDSAVMVGGSGLYLAGVWDGFDPIPKSKAMREQLMNQFQKSGLKPLLKELEERDPSYFLEVDHNNPQRIIRALEVVRSSGRPYSEFRKNAKKTKKDYSDLKIGLEIPRDELYKLLDTRMDQMISKGLFKEAEDLYEYRNLNALQTVGYSEIFDFIDGQYGYEEAVRLLKRNTRRYAKRQLTWFKRYTDISWFDPREANEIERFILSHIG